MAQFKMLSGKALTIVSSKTLGERIGKAVKAGSDVSQEIHEIAVQCALHIWDNGDVSLAKRLCDELEKASGFNVQGLRKWFGDACPMIARSGGDWKLMDKSSTTYSAYITRMMEMTAKRDDDGKPVKDDNGNFAGQPDEAMGPGERLFFIGWCADHPFWTDAAVIQTQRQNIRVIGLKQVLGFAYAVKTQYRKAKDAGTFAGNESVAEDFLAKLSSFVADFEKQHAADILASEREASEKAEAIKSGEAIKATQEIVNTTGASAGAPEVGGDVGEGLQSSDADTQKTGTEG